MLGEKRFIKSIRLRNLLSYGEGSEEISTESLNVLIGPNSSGKSNLIEVIGILQSAPSDLTAAFRRSGSGVAEWLWKGSENTPNAEIEVTVYYPAGVMGLRHRISFTVEGQRFQLVDEVVENERRQHQDQRDAFFYYRFQDGHPLLSVRTVPQDHPRKDEDRVERKLRREDVALDQSVLSQRKDPDQYPEITYLATQYSKMKLYREWILGRYTPPRLPQPTDSPGDFLEEDARNLGLVLNALEHQGGKTWEMILENLRRFADGFNDISTRIQGGTVQVFLREKELRQPIPATRLSDGTLRFLCLLSVLCHPSPPPVICIEEPELDLHPDILPAIAELLVDASSRTQLFVTTHSDILIDALSETPEAVIVCEKSKGASTLRRLDKEELAAWLKRYSLGQLWRTGELGGNRW